MSHAKLIAGVLESKGFPIYRVRKDAVLVKFQNRTVGEIELTRALLGEVEEGLIEVSCFAGIGRVSINQ